MNHEYEARHVTTIHAPAELCYSVLNDFENYTDWFPFIRSMDIQSTDEMGRPLNIKYVFDVVLKQGFEITLQYQYDDDGLILHFSAVDGTFSDARGFYSFKETGNDTTAAQFYVHVSLSLQLPDRISRYLIENASKNILMKLKKEAEHRVHV
ncbi:MAG: type II toxin-antitoxin system RatA family toxin [Spirochaetota bacterium]